MQENFIHIPLTVGFFFVDGKRATQFITVNRSLSLLICGHEHDSHGNVWDGGNGTQMKMRFCSRGSLDLQAIVEFFK